MRKSLLVLSAVGLVTACGHSSESDSATKQVAIQPQKKKPAYCFFKDEELKGWTAKRDKQGDITVNGKAHVSDPRYKAVLGSPDIRGAAATISPTIAQNDTGFGAPADTWNVTAAIPNAAAITSVTVTCGEKVVAQLQVPAKG